MYCKTDTRDYVPITLNEWTHIYNKMMGISEPTEENVVIETPTNTIYNKIYSPDTELTHEEYETEDEN
jgi:hypothetical protein